MAREQLKNAANDWTFHQVPLDWAGPVAQVLITYTDGSTATVNPTDWIGKVGNRVLVLTDAEHTAAFEPWVP